MIEVRISANNWILFIFDQIGGFYSFLFQSGDYSADSILPRKHVILDEGIRELVQVEQKQVTLLYAFPLFCY